MIKKLSVGPLHLDQDHETIFKTPAIIGYVERIKVSYSNNAAEDVVLEIKSEDEEIILSVEGSKDGIWYPRNWNVQNQQYTGVNMAGEGQNTMGAEKWLVHGSLIIVVKGSLSEDFINEIEFLFDGDYMYDDFEKDVGMVSSSTTGVSNSLHSPKSKKRRQIYLQNILNQEIGDITKSKDHKEVLMSKGSDLREFVEEALFKRTFAGVNKSLSILIKEYLMRSIAKGYTPEKVIKYLTRKGIPISQANNILRTEHHAIKSKVREWSYKQLEETEGEIKVRWIGPRDHRRTKTCEKISKRTEKGVSIELLKKIIQEEVNEAINRGELPSDYDPREFTPHFKCRHTFVRVRS